MAYRRIGLVCVALLASGCAWMSRSESRATNRTESTAPASASPATMNGPSAPSTSPGMNACQRQGGVWRSPEEICDWGGTAIGD